MHHSDAKYRTIMCRIRHSMFLLYFAYTTFPICKRLSAIFPCYFCLSFSKPLSIPAERHKNSSHKHSADFHQQNCHHCHCLFLLFCFRKVSLYCQSVFLLLLFHNHLKTVCKIQCCIHISFFLPVQIIFCDLSIRFLHC